MSPVASSWWGCEGWASPIELPWLGAMKAPCHSNSRKEAVARLPATPQPTWQGWVQRPLARRSPAKYQVPKGQAHCRPHDPLVPPFSCCLAAMHHMSVCPSGQGGGPKIHYR